MYMGTICITNQTIHQNFVSPYQLCSQETHFFHAKVHSCTHCLDGDKKITGRCLWYSWGDLTDIKYGRRDIPFESINIKYSLNNSAISCIIIDRKSSTIFSIGKIFYDVLCSCCRDHSRCRADIGRCNISSPDATGSSYGPFIECESC